MTGASVHVSASQLQSITLPLRSAEFVVSVHVLTLPFLCNFNGRQIQFPSGSMTLILQTNCQLLENWIHQCNTDFKGQVEIKGVTKVQHSLDIITDIFLPQYLSTLAKKRLKLQSYIFSSLNLGFCRFISQLSL